MPQNEIKILNAAGGRGRTSAKRALRDVRRGRARWARPDAIEYITAGDPRHMAVLSTARLRECGYDRASSTGLASMEAIRGLPIAGPVIRVLTDTSKSVHRAPRGKNGPVRIIMQMDSAGTRWFESHGITA